MKPALLLNFTKQELLDRYSASLFGGLWTLINPLVQILIFSLVFSKIMGARMGSLGVEFNEYGYSIYLIPGILAWNAFANTLGRVSTVFQDKAGLISKINIRLQLLPLYIVLSEAIIFAISMVFFAGFLILIDYPITWLWLWMFPVFCVQQLLAYSLGFWAAVLGVFLRDIIELVRIVIQLWFWLTPIVYVVDIVSSGFRTLFDINPLFHIVIAYREVILYQRPPDLGNLLVLSLLGLLIMTLALITFRSLEKDVRDFI